MRAKQNCPRCGAELPGGNWGGFCPACLARVSLTPALARRGLKDELSKDVATTLAPESPNGAVFPSRRFGDYELLEEIGQGGMAVVWRARQCSVNRTVALKLLRAAAFAR